MRIHKEVIKGSAILLVGFGLYNFFHFLFQFFMARYLTVSEYSVLASVFVIVYISSVFSESIQNFVVTYVGKEEDPGKIKNLINRLIKKMTKIAGVVFLGYLIGASILSKILDISYLTLSLGAIILVFSILLPITRGVMQGKKKFVKLSANMIFESTIKLFAGLGMVLLGFGVNGAIVGVIAASAVSFFISIVQLKDLRSAKEVTITTKYSYREFLPAFILTSAVVVFYSIDVWFARVLFETEISGAYALASLLGKVLFWATIPISKAMLSLSSDSKQEKPKSVFKTALLFLSLIIIFIAGTFYLFPEEIIKFFSGKVVPEAVEILFYEGLAFGIIAISNILILYKLSINRVKNYSLMFLPIVSEMIILVVFSKSLLSFSKAFLGSALIFLIFSVLFYKLNRDTHE